MDSGVYDNLSGKVIGPEPLGRSRATVNAYVAPAKPWAILNAYLALAKPRAILPHFVTAAAAMFLATGSVPPCSILLLTLLGGGCAAAAANALNCVLDRDIDAMMARTCGRPLPSRLIKPNHALAFAAITALAGICILGTRANRLAAILAVVALVYYVLIYTFWLRRRTYWGAIVGSAIGAIPPIIGWVVVTDSITVTPFILAAIIMLWTVPHFWALALFRRDDYAKAGLRIIPEKGVGVWIIACSVLLVATSLLLAPVARLGPIYIVSACLLGAGLLYLGLRADLGTKARGGVRLSRQEPGCAALSLQEPGRATPSLNHRNRAAVSLCDRSRAAQRLFGYSILYVAALFAAMIIDRIISGA